AAVAVSVTVFVVVVVLLPVLAAGGWTAGATTSGTVVGAVLSPAAAAGPVVAAGSGGAAVKLARSTSLLGRGRVGSMISGSPLPPASCWATCCAVETFVIGRCGRAAPVVV